MFESIRTPEDGRIIGSSVASRHALLAARQVASTETTVFLQGESVTGNDRPVHSPNLCAPNGAVRRGQLRSAAWAAERRIESMEARTLLPRK